MTEGRKLQFQASRAAVTANGRWLAGGVSSNFSKAIASGFPVAAVAGRAELLELFATGGVVHGGTYNGQTLCMVGMAMP
jgi:glutamate-1-semialdehyde aminotransferase